MGDAPPYGLHAKRGCTDILFVLLLVAALVGWGVMAAIAWENGNPWRLLYGTDYLGNVCGKGGSKNAPRRPENVDWGEMDLLWYPFDDITDSNNAINMGVCVTECPSEGSTVQVYADPSNTTHNMPATFAVSYSSSPTFRRCIPDKNSSAVVQKLADLIDISDYLFEGIAEVRAAEDTIGYSVGVSVVLALVWLVLVYFFALPMLLLSIAVIVGGATGAGFLLYSHANDLNDDGNSDYKWVRAAAWIIWIFGGLFFLLCVFMAGKIRRGAKIASEGSKVLLTMPSILFIPLIFAILLGVWAAMALLTTLYIQTMQDTKTESFDWAGSTVDGFVEDIPVNRDYFHAYNVIFFVWMGLFLLDTEYLCTALTAAFWYFANEDGVRKDPPTCSPFVALCTCLQHLGTTAFGSAIITICKVIRWILLRVEDRLKGASDYVKCCFKIAQCCLWCLEKCLKLLSEKAYVMTAIEGTNFCGSARRAISLIVMNFASVAIVEIITAFMVLIGKLLIVAATGVFAYFCLEKWNVSPDVETYWVPLIVICILAYIVSGVFVHIFSTVVDTIMLCHCVDKEAHHEPRYGNNRTRNIAAGCNKHDAYVGH